MKNIYQITKYFAAVLSALTFWACSSEPELPEPTVEPASGRMVLVYQVADNNLSTYSDDDYREMLEGAADIGTDNHLLVYRHTNTVEPMLVEIKASGVDTIATYGNEMMSVDTERLARVIADAKEHANALQHGLILWSHGSGWLQDGIEQTPSTLSFGIDEIDKKYYRMNITDLATTLEEAGGFDWIYFDCCYMMTVETLYELRKATPLFAGSVTELQGPGMPYHLNLKYFFAPDETDLVGAARSTFDYYRERIAADPTNRLNNYCTMSVVKASALDKVALATKNIFAKADGNLPADFRAQCYSNVSRETSCYYFDFAHYVHALTHNADGTARFDGADQAYAAYLEAMADAVAYDAATPYLRDLPIDYHCGMSTYILRNSSSHTTKNYDELSWYADVASALKF